MNILRPRLDRVSFADGYPLLVTTAASLADLNARLGAPVPMARFRTNRDIRPLQNSIFRRR